MSALKIESEVVTIDNSAENVFTYLCDFNNFKSMMPDKVTDWKSTAGECSFVINGMVTIGMIIVEKVPYSLIRIKSNGKVPFEFELDVHLSSTAAKACTGQLVFTSDLNPMMKMMVEKPLTNFFNVLANKMKDIK